MGDSSFVASSISNAFSAAATASATAVTSSSVDPFSFGSATVTTPSPPALWRRVVRAVLLAARDVVVGVFENDDFFSTLLRDDDESL